MNKVIDASISLDVGDKQVDVFVSNIGESNQDKYLLEIVITEGEQTPSEAKRIKFKGSSSDCFKELVEYLNDPQT